MSTEPSPLEALAERFAHPAARVLARELTRLARDLERGALAWPRAPASERNNAALSGLESIEAALNRRRAEHPLAVDQSDWADFGRALRGIAGAAPDAGQPPAGAPPASVIALRLIWGAERFSELPTVILKPPPAPFLVELAVLPAPEDSAPPEQLARTVSAWLQARQPAEPGLLAAADVRGFARVVAACRVVGQRRKAVTLEDAAAGYLAWARLLRADPQRLSDISSGWWSASGHQPGR